MLNVFKKLFKKFDDYIDKKLDEMVEVAVKGEKPKEEKEPDLNNPKYED